MVSTAIEGKSGSIPQRGVKAKERDIRCHFSYWKFDDSIHFIFTRTFAEQDCRLMQVVSIKDINNNSDIIGQYIVELIEDKLSDENCRKMILDRIEKLL